MCPLPLKDSPDCPFKRKPRKVKIFYRLVKQSLKAVFWRLWDTIRLKSFAGERDIFSNICILIYMFCCHYWHFQSVWHAIWGWENFDLWKIKKIIILTFSISLATWDFKKFWFVNNLKLHYIDTNSSPSYLIRLYSSPNTAPFPLLPHHSPSLPHPGVIPQPYSLISHPHTTYLFPHPSPVLPHLISLTPPPLPLISPPSSLTSSP